MKSINYISLLVLLLFFLNSCAPCGSINNRVACMDKFYFKIVNKNNNQDIYLSDRCLSTNTLVGSCYSMIDSSNFVYNAGPSYPIDTAYLKIEPGDYDTLVFSLSHGDTKCCPDYGIINTIHYNGNNCNRINGVFLFEK